MTVRVYNNRRNRVILLSSHCLTVVLVSSIPQEIFGCYSLWNLPCSLINVALSKLHQSNMLILSVHLSILEQLLQLGLDDKRTEYVIYL